MGAAGTPGWAADGDGGAGGSGAMGGSASLLSTGGPGGDGSAANAGGAGGGAGVTGGPGGNGYAGPDGGGTGGFGGVGAGNAGADGLSGSGTDAGSGGGGGGAHGYVGSLSGLTTAGISGGNGGAGGITYISAYAGGGGGGGFGAIVTGLSGTGGLISRAISGGNGGNTEGIGASGGNGGSGLVILQPAGDNTLTLTQTAVLSGGNGGNGFTAGGSGGTALVLRDGPGSTTLDLGGPITGGRGGDGFVNATGGDGGNGIAVINMTGLTTINVGAAVTGGTAGSGDATGGNGGAGIVGSTLHVTVNGSEAPITIRGGAGASGTVTGLGGAGVTGSDITIVLTGAASVVGGANAGSGQAAAIDFTGGTNTLELRAGGGNTPTVSGGVSHAGGSDTIILAGSGTGSLDTSLIEGFGTFVKAGSSTWTLTGMPVYSVNSWAFNGGTVSISSNLFGSSIPLVFNGGTLATTATFVLSEQLDMQGAGTLSPASGTSLIIAAELSGTGSLTKTGEGSLILSAESDSYGGAVTVTAGTLVLNGIGNLPGAPSWTLNGGNLDLSQRVGATALQQLSGNSAPSDVSLGSNALTLVQTTNATYAGTFSGTGDLTKTGAGTLVLTGDSSLSGTTTIMEGTLQLGDGGTTGSLAGAIVNNAILAINRADDVTLTNAISGTGVLQLEGGGTVTFGSAYGGSITALGSGIQLSGDTLSSASVALGNGAVLSGNGAVGNLTVLAAGIVAPGNSPGTLTVNGPVAFNGGSVYRVDATPTGAHDLITATGTVTLSAGSAVRVVAAPGAYAANTTYTILTSADTVSGTFSGVTSNYAFLTPSLGYDAQNVYLTLTYTGTQFASLAQTANHASVAGTVQGLGFGNEVFDALLLLPQGAVTGALDALSGEAYASVNTVIQQQSIYVREAVGDRLRQALTAPGVSPLAYGAGPQTAELGEGLTPTLWMQGYGGWGDTSSDGNAAGISNSIGGFLMGADVALAPNVRAGLFGGFSQSWFDVDERNASGSMDSYDIGVYAGAQFGAIALRGGAAYAWNDVSMSRTVAFPGFAQAVEGDDATGTTQIFGEVGYDMAIGAYAFEPFAGLAYVHVSGAEFTESGGSAALSVSTGSMDTLYSTLGLRVATTLEVGGRTLTPHATLGWQHAFGDMTPAATLQFASGSTPFTVSGVPIAEDSLLLEAGLRYALSDTAQLGASYSGQFAGDATQNAFTVQFSMRF